VDAGSWRAVARLTVAPGQERFVAAPTYYLAFCTYGDVWHPMSVHDADNEVVGFLMWGVDDDDGSTWLGGILVDARNRGRVGSVLGGSSHGGGSGTPYRGSDPGTPRTPRTPGSFGGTGRRSRRSGGGRF